MAAMIFKAPPQGGHCPMAAHGHRRAEFLMVLAGAGWRSDIPANQNADVFVLRASANYECKATSSRELTIKDYLAKLGAFAPS